MGRFALALQHEPPPLVDEHCRAPRERAATCGSEPSHDSAANALARCAPGAGRELDRFEYSCGAWGRCCDEHQGTKSCGT